MRKSLATVIAGLVVMGVAASACQPPADVASRNLSTAADNFEIMRRVVFYNGITDTYMLTVEGRCSLGNDNTDSQISITCRTGEDDYIKHFLGLSDNVTYFVEQLEGADVSTFHYRVQFRPQSIIPDVDLQIDTDELTTDRNEGVSP